MSPVVVTGGVAIGNTIRYLILSPRGQLIEYFTNNIFVSDTCTCVQNGNCAIIAPKKRLDSGKTW